MRMIGFENFSAPCPLFEGFRGQTTSREYDIRKPCRAGRGSGSRVSELRHITAEAVREGRAAVRNKGKTRVILIPAALRKLLLGYMKKTDVTTGSVFLSKNKTPLDRSTVWRRMKALCERAGVDPRKVFPHSLRHLFARVFYSVEKDLLRLADILGHASVNTTRIYTMETGRQCHRTPPMWRGPHSRRRWRRRSGQRRSR